MSVLWRLRALRASRRAPGSVIIARSVRIDEGVRIEVAPGARLEIGEDCHLEPHARIFVRGGCVELHDGVVLGERSTLVALQGITLRERARLGLRAAVMDFELDSAREEPDARSWPLEARAVEIGAGAIIETGAVVGAGVSVPTDRRVTPGALLVAPREDRSEGA